MDRMRVFSRRNTCRGRKIVRHFTRILAGILFVAAGPCARALPQAQDEVSAEVEQHAPVPEMKPYVSDRLAPVEQDYMRHAMEQLPDTMKERFQRAGPERVSVAIYDSATGAVHFNRPELEGHLSVEKSEPLPGDDYPFPLPGEDDAAGRPSPEKLTYCGTNPVPGCEAGGGPYRRVFTPKVAAEKVCPSYIVRPCGPKYGIDTGYWNAGTVSVGCRAGAFKPGDAGFAFLGAYSGKPTETGGTVDGGLEYLYEQDPKDPTLDRYRLFLGILNVAKLVYTSSPSADDPEPPLLDCGGTATMELRIAPWEMNLDTVPGSGCASSKTINSPWKSPFCGTVAFILERGRGGIGEQYDEDAIVYIAPKISYGGWGQIAISDQGTGKNPDTHYWPQVPCGGCVFKWMTSVAQKQEDLLDGSTFSATWSNRQIAPWAVHPGDVNTPTKGNPVPMTEDLTLCSEYPLWHGTYSGKTVLEDCADTPREGLTGVETVVRASGYSVSGERDGFVLH